MRPGGPLLRYADETLMAGLVAMILFLPFSELLKNVAYGVAIFGWIMKRVKEGGGSWRWTPLGPFLFAYLVVTILSASMALDPKEGFGGAWDIFRPFSLFLLIVNEVDSEKKIKRCVWAFIISTGLGALLGLSTYAWDILSGERFAYLGIHSLGHPNHTATYLVMMLSLMISLLSVVQWPLPVRMAVTATAVLTLTALVLTFSRGALLAFLVFLLFLTVMRRTWKPLVPFSLGMAGIMVVASVILTFTSSYNLLAWKIGKLQDLPQDHTLQLRLAIWKGAMRSIGDHPLLGVGPRNFKNLDAVKYDLPRKLKDGLLKGPNHGFNLFVTVGIERGILGLVALLALMMKFLQVWWKLRQQRSSQWSEGLWYGAMGAFIAVIVAGLVTTTLHSEGAIAFWSMTALTLSSSGLQVEKGSV